MITRQHTSQGTMSKAQYSPCETYRYGLQRVWDKTAPVVLFIMLNPSTADERRNDPTIERCERRARAWGYGALRIANLFAFRATDPRDLKRASDPVGPGNAALLRRWHRAADLTLAAWGVHGSHRGQAQDTLSDLSGPLYHLGLTKAGHPRHPLYVPYATTPTLWERRDD